MNTQGVHLALPTTLLAIAAMVMILAVGSALLGLSRAAFADAPQETQTRVEAALGNIMKPDCPGEDGLATFWDGNKYVQCRRMRDRRLANARRRASLIEVKNASLGAMVAGGKSNRGIGVSSRPRGH